MATMNELSATLTKFKEAYSSISGISTDGITSPLTDAGNTLDSAISGFSAAANDSTVTDIVSGVTLAKEGIERVKGHVEADISALKTNASQVMNTIQLIDELITKGATLTGREVKTETDKNGKSVEVVYDNDQTLIDKYNDMIDHYNKEGEEQLTAMATAINGVSFGVAGNMTFGGSIGNSVGYSDGYDYTFDEYIYEPPKEDDTKKTDEEVVKASASEELTFGEKVEACVVGTVSGPLKLVEGVGDFGTMILGSIVSLFSREAADSIYEFAEQDLVGSATTAIFGEKITESSEYQTTQDISKFVTYEVGRMVCPPVGAMVAQCGLSGNAMEAIYAETGRADVSIGAGLLLEEVQGRLNATTGAATVGNVVSEIAAYAIPETVTNVVNNDVNNKKKNNKDNDDKKDNK